MVKPIIALVLWFCSTNSGASGNLRYYYAYADASLVNLAITTGSDPFAEIGKEIPNDRPLRIPASNFSGGFFKVQLRALLTSNDSWHVGGSQDCNLVFDRTLAENGSINPPLSSTSFRKLSYAFGPPGQFSIELRDNFTNLATVPLFDRNDQPLDENHDGIQDAGALNVAGPSVVRASWRAPDTLEDRPVGIGASLESPSYFRLYSGQSFRFADVSFRSQMLSGQTYGTGLDETGLQIFTVGRVDGALNSTALYGRGPAPDTYTGARYNLLAVPEPGGIVPLGIFLIFVRRHPRK